MLTFAWLVGSLAVLFALTLLLSARTAAVARDVIVCLVMALVAFVAFRNIKELNK